MSGRCCRRRYNVFTQLSIRRRNLKTISNKLIWLSCAQSSCRYELKNDLTDRSVYLACSTCNILFIWERVVFSVVTGKLRSYSSQPTFTSICRRTRLSSAFSVYSARRIPGLNKPMINLRDE
ncbi:hypothetical protein BYT27DRAFT_7180211 [Phlegmacium glaucopus]|nr:hypothetical protein BYT27DRAFT_7180211 [Phlegmacium glaucopus]